MLLLCCSSIVCGYRCLFVSHMALASPLIADKCTLVEGDAFSAERPVKILHLPALVLLIGAHNRALS